MRFKNITVIARSELKRVWNNKALLMLLVIAPIIIVIAFGFVTYKNPDNIKTTIFVDRPQFAAVDPEVRQIITSIERYTRADGSKPFLVVETNSRADALQQLDQGKTRAIIIFDQDEAGLKDIKVLIDVTETAVTNEISEGLKNVFLKYSRESSIDRMTEFLVNNKGLPVENARYEAKKIVAPFDVSVETSAWMDLRYFDFYASAMIMIVAMGLPLALSLISITSERARGTIERIFVSPYTRMEILSGKLLAFSVFAVIIAVLVTVTMKTVFNIALGNVWLILLATILIGINGVVFGLLISSVTHTEAESVIVGILCIFAFMGLMTYMVPWETMHEGAGLASKFLPYTWGIQAIRNINMTGAGIQDVWQNLLILFTGIVVQLMIAVPVLRREIK